MIRFKNNYGTINLVADGTSNTIIMGEDAPWRNHASIFPFAASTALDPATEAGVVPVGNESDGFGKRALNRWAEPENANGVSGPPTADPASARLQRRRYLPRPLGKPERDPHRRTGHVPLDFQ